MISSRGKNLIMRLFGKLFRNRKKDEVPVLTEGSDESRKRETVPANQQKGHQNAEPSKKNGNGNDTQFSRLHPGWSTVFEKVFNSTFIFKIAFRTRTLQNALVMYSLILKKSKLFVRVLPYISTPLLGGSSPVGFLSFAITLILVILTVRYLHYLHAKSDMTRRRQLKLFKIELKDKMIKLNCSPIMLRLAWSDSASYDKSIKNWPLCGGATGSIRFERESKHSVNAGLDKALDILQEVKCKYATISWADAIQMAGALAVQVTGGPVVPLRYGRLDSPESTVQVAKSSNLPAMGVNGEPNSVAGTLTGTKCTGKRFSECPILSARLPCAVPPFPDNAPSADVHIRNCFYRMGYSTRDIVALCGAHTIGRAFKDRSGVCAHTSGDQGATRYTRPTSIAKVRSVSDMRRQVQFFLPNLPSPPLLNTHTLVRSLGRWVPWHRHAWRVQLDRELVTIRQLVFQSN